MKGAILEVFLVSAEKVGHTNLIGKPKYFVILQCGNQLYKTSISEGSPKEICWNEKYTFEIPNPEMKDRLYLKLRIMDEEFFTDGGFVGQTTIYLKGIITEGELKGQLYVKPTPYNVVLEDDTYKGQISIGLKYISSRMVKGEKRVNRRDEKDEKEEKGVSNSMGKSLSSLRRTPWWRSLLLCKKNDKSSDKDMPN